MPKKSKSTQVGVLKDGTTGSPPASQSTNGESPSISDTLGFDLSRSPNSQLTESLPTTTAKMIQALAKKLVELGLVRWRKVSAKGERAWVLWFPDEKWVLDPVSKELLPK